MATEPPRFRPGQQVRIVVCPQNHPDHIGQAGTVTQNTRGTGRIRVHVGLGLCQATQVEDLDGPGVEVRGQSAGVFSNLMPPEFRRKRR